MQIWVRISCFTIGLLLWPSAIQAAPIFHSMFSDHAVLQRDKPIAIWGTAAPSELVKVNIDRKALQTKADAQGNWRVTFPAMKAGGPYTVSVANAAGNTSHISDIKIGDVFLCSGQSNMDWSVKAGLNADAELQKANHPDIRLYNVAKSSAPTPQSTFAHPQAWAIATPATVADFSAVCYFYARDLHTHIKVPVGLIHASWGGSAIESWLSADQLSRFDHQEDLKTIRALASDERATQRAFGQKWEAWWRNAFPDAGEPWRDATHTGWSPAPLPLRDWKNWGDAKFTNFDGMVWFKKSVTLTQEQAQQANKMHLGAMDEVDMIWINGQPLGQTFGWSSWREYTIPANMFRAGKNDIIINIFSGSNMGGLLGPIDAMRLELRQGAAVSLGDGWVFKSVPGNAGEPPRAPWLPIGGLTTIGNAMIDPIAPYGISATLWYQGESNADKPSEYRALLTAMMQDWRGRLNNPDMPFLIVQLPNFGQPKDAPAQSNWAEFREAQRLAVRDDPLSGLAVIIDSGDNADIHPRNKQIVGARLARLARQKLYRQIATGTGPYIHSAKQSGSRITLSFSGVEKGLKTKDGARPNWFELCGTEQSSCRLVLAQIQGSRVMIENLGPEPATRIRYCWGDAPACKLYDAAGLPAGPFEIALP